MSSAEDKLDVLLKEVKNLTVGQLKLTETVESVNTKSAATDKIDVDLAEEVRSLTSRLEALEALSTAQQKVPPREEGGRAKGHRFNYNLQGDDDGTQLPHHTLGKGEKQLSKYMHDDAPEPSSRRSDFGFHHRELKLPKLEFPKFSGENPRVWREKCEKYFSMYNVPVHLWFSFATINFKGNAELWLQTYEAQHSIESWPELCVAVENKFGQDLYQNNMRDLLAIKQTSDVLEYSERFEKAKHRVLVHNKDMGEVFFVQKFIDGLRHEISDVIVLHKPRTVDGALSLAIMQEQVLEATNQRIPGRARDHGKGVAKHIPSSYSPQANSVLGTAPTATTEAPGKHLRQANDNKFAQLRAQRRAKGLCMKCGEPYSPQHKCPTQVSLQLVEELLEILEQQTSDNDATSNASTSESDEELLTLSVNAVEGTMGLKTIRLQGLIQNQEVLILVDSGSSSTFIHQDLVAQLKLPVTQITPLKVTVAGGTTLPCDRQVNQVQWFTQGSTFSTDAKVLPLGSYDMILGMDWLEAHSPMWVHWRRKHLRFAHMGKRITIRGVKDCTTHCKKLTVKKLKGLLRKGAVSHVIQLSPEFTSKQQKSKPKQ
ncbi:unnamed protein product [Urochloa humidicola]